MTKHPLARSSLKDKSGCTALDLVSPSDTTLRELFRQSQAQASISKDDIADGESPGCMLQTQFSKVLQMTMTKEKVPAQVLSKSDWSLDLQKS